MERKSAAPSIIVVYRDSTGRVREESGYSIAGPDGKPEPSGVKIMDPSAQIEYQLDLEGHVAYRLYPPKHPVIASDERAIPMNPPVKYQVKDLGSHYFQGVNVEGRQSVSPDGSATQEVWIWPYLNMAVLNKSENPLLRRTDAWLQLSSAEPDPALFRVPDGWKVVDAMLAPQPGMASVYLTTAGYRYNITIPVPQRADYVVKEAPYSAEQLEELTNYRAPGQVTVDRPPTKIYRDIAGRTRVERVEIQASDSQSGPILPVITDPVDDIEIVLDPFHRVAHRFALPEPTTIPPSTVARQAAHSNSVSSEKDLGEDTMDGLKVTGTLQTYITPVGADGNNHELTDTVESWYSPALRVIVMTKQNSASQHLTERLTHISTEEPDHSLFEIPDGYTVVDEKSAVTITITQP